MAIQFSHVEMTRYRILIHILHILGSQVLDTTETSETNAQVTVNNSLTFSQTLLLVLLQLSHR